MLRLIRCEEYLYPLNYETIGYYDIFILFIIKREKILRNPYESSYILVESRLAIASVPSGSKMYRTSAVRKIHSVLHAALKNRVYVVHFAGEIYTLISKSYTNIYIILIKY